MYRVECSHYSSWQCSTLSVKYTMCSVRMSAGLGTWQQDQQTCLHACFAMRLLVVVSQPAAVLSLFCLQVLLAAFTCCRCTLQQETGALHL